MMKLDDHMEKVEGALRLRRDPALKESQGEEGSSSNARAPGGKRVQLYARDRDLSGSRQATAKQAFRGMVQQLKDTEAKHPIGNCAYCLRKRVFLVSLPCSHSYCAMCCEVLIKVTKIKKGLVIFNDANLENLPDEEPLKCPKCNLLHMITEKEKAVFAEVIGVEAIKERVKKRNEVKLQNLYKDEHSRDPEIQLKVNIQLCHHCPPNMVNPQNGAQFQCITCESLLLCYPCKVKHAAHPKRKKHQIINYAGYDTDLIRITQLNCQKHEQKFSLYCFHDEQPLCTDCNTAHETEVDEPDAANADLADGTESPPKRFKKVNYHDGHYIKNLDQVLRTAE